MKKSQILFYMLADFAISGIALLAAILLRFEFNVPKEYWDQYITVWILFGGVQVLLNIVFGNYKSSWTYKGVSEVLRLALTEQLFIIVFLLLKYTKIYDYSGSILLIHAALSYLLFCFIRYFMNAKQYVMQCIKNAGKNTQRASVLIIAQKEIAYTIARSIMDREEPYKVIGILDSNPEDWHMSVIDIDIIGGINQLGAVCGKNGVTEVIVDLSNLSNDEVRYISSYCNKNNIKVSVFQQMLDFEEFASKKRGSLRDICAEDLIGRTEIKLEKDSICQFISGKRILVTGAAGSIGTEICRQVLELGCQHLYMFDINENGLFYLRNNLSETYSDQSFRPIIGSIQDQNRLDSIFSECRPDVVFHAAAHKHVLLVEENPCEAVKNNVFGSLNVMNACIRHDVKKLIVISSDKAVNPANVMGASKRIVELLVQCLGKNAKTEMAAVRFGNVIGSNGSVIPIFEKQIANGGPVTVTHRDVERYFMTIAEAVQLVLQAGAFASQGEIFVLDMGKMVRIYDLAKDLIEMAGLELGKDIEITITGLRPGEKLFEELRLDHENMDTTAHEKIFVCHPVGIDEDRFMKDIDRLKRCADDEDANRAVDIIFQIVPSDYRVPSLRMVEEHSAPAGIAFNLGMEINRTKEVKQKMYLRIRDDMLLREIAGQWIVIPIGESVVSVGGIISLNETGAFIWEKIGQNCDSVDKLTAALMNEFSVDMETALADVTSFIDEMRNKELLV